MNNTVYKIYNPTTGLYSRGGTYTVRWSKKGKTWIGSGPLRNHLNQLYQHTSCGYRWPYDGCEIVELVVVEPTEKARASVKEFLDGH